MLKLLVGICVEYSLRYEIHIILILQWMTLFIGFSNSCTAHLNLLCLRSYQFYRVKSWTIKQTNWNVYDNQTTIIWGIR